MFVNFVVKLGVEAPNLGGSNRSASTVDIIIVGVLSKKPNVYLGFCVGVFSEKEAVRGGSGGL